MCFDELSTLKRISEYAFELYYFTIGAQCNPHLSDGSRLMIIMTSTITMMNSVLCERASKLQVRTCRRICAVFFLGQQTTANKHNPKHKKTNNKRATLWARSSLGQLFWCVCEFGHDAFRLELRRRNKKQRNNMLNRRFRRWKKERDKNRVLGEYRRWWF